MGLRVQIRFFARDTAMKCELIERTERRCRERPHEQAPHVTAQRASNQHELRRAEREMHEVLEQRHAPRLQVRT